MMTLEECIVKRGWNKNVGIIQSLEKMRLRIRNRMPDGNFKLTKLQQKAIDTPGFWRDWDSDDPQNTMIQGSTSAGKTLLAELAILDTLAHEQRTIFLVPLKSMVNERKKQFSHDMNSYFEVCAASSDYMEYDERLIRGEDYDIAVIVYEKFFAMLSQGNQQIMKNCGLLVVDEMAMLAKEQRGPKLELAVEIVRRNHLDTRILCLATSDCNTDKVCQWLNIDNEHRIFSAARPVALQEHLVLLNGEGQYRNIPADSEDVEGKDTLSVGEKELIKVPGYQREWKADDKKLKLLKVIIEQLLGMDSMSRILIFVSSQAEAAKIASFLAETLTHLLPLFAEKSRESAYDDFLQKLSSCEEDEGQINLIQKLVPHAIAYHHAGLSTTLRELIEEEFSRDNSLLRIIVATETLTIGVNMPFDAMIMMTNKVPRGVGVPVALSQQEYRNYIGRAGRLGLSNTTGITYIILEDQKSLTYYWNSYGSREEIESALASPKLKEAQWAAYLAPYFLSLLMDSNRNGFTLDDLHTLYRESLTYVCANGRAFDAEKLYESLWNAYLANKITSSGKGRGRGASEEYEIEQFGKHMAPYAFSLDTCIDIYEKFYYGKAHHGLPENITGKDIDNDKYLLDILYHVCRHQEVENSSVITYPKDDHNPTRLLRAKKCVIQQLSTILREEDSDGNRCYRLWGETDQNDLYRFMNDINLGNEDRIAEAALRAVLLFYWTKGKAVRNIPNISSFRSFTKVTAGDIERLAEVVSFHVDAIWRCLSTFSGMNEDVVDSFYKLQCRIKYGMSWDLVRLANKHVHGLDRNRLLQMEVAAKKNDMRPVDYLYYESAEVLDKFLTRAQRNSLMEALEQRGEANEYNSLMEIVSKDAGSQMTSLQKEGIDQIYNFDSGDAGDLYSAIRDTVNDNVLLPSISVYTDGTPDRIIWQGKSEEIIIGILTDLNDTAKISEIRDYFSSRQKSGKQCILLACRRGDTNSWYSDLSSVAHQIGSQTVFDNEFLAMILANTILKDFDKADPITAFFKDARGVYTNGEYKYYSPENYLENVKRVDEADLYFLCNKSRRAYSNRDINIHDLQTQLAKEDKELSVSVLSWGTGLEYIGEDVFNKPVVILLEREMITRSQSLFTFIYMLENKTRFRNCLLILSSDDAKRKWNEHGSVGTQTVGECNWRANFCGIDNVVIHDTNSAAKSIIDYCRYTWKPNHFLIGVSYAHEDSYNDEDRSDFYSDNMLLKQVVDQLRQNYGEHQILFDQFKKANELFERNCAREESLIAYRTCKVYIILWNTFTINNDNCQKEREVIFECCKGNKARYFYLCPSKAPDPPESDFALSLNNNQIQTIVDEIKKALEELI